MKKMRFSQTLSLQNGGADFSSITITIPIDIASYRCPFLPVTMFSTALLSTALAVSLSSIAQGQNCGAYPFFINASDSVTRFDPFQPPIGPLRNESA
jgi:hypothetical protein